MVDKKWYTVWVGEQKGVFDSRDQVRPFVSGFKGAKYKSFPSLQQANEALEVGREQYYQPQQKWFEKELPFIKKSIAVDAACSSATGVLEYQGIDLWTQQQVFYHKLPVGTNNIGEFLALVHGLSYIQQEKKTDYVLYSDSKIAINRIAQGKCKTNIVLSEDTQRAELFALIQRAEHRLKRNPLQTQILKRNTKERGEIPADFGRK